MSQRFFFLHKPLLTSNFFFPLQSLGEPIPQENAVCPGASWTARHALHFSWVPASQSFEMITRATRVSVAAAKIQVLGSRKTSLRAEIIKTAAVRGCRQQNPSRGPAGTRAGEALSTYGAAEVGGEGTEPQRQGLVSLGGQSSALGAGSTGVGSAPLGRQGQQEGEACSWPT